MPRRLAAGALLTAAFGAVVSFTATTAESPPPILRDYPELKSGGLLIRECRGVAVVPVPDQPEARAADRLRTEEGGKSLARHFLSGFLEQHLEGIEQPIPGISAWVVGGATGRRAVALYESSRLCGRTVRGELPELPEPVPVSNETDTSAVPEDEDRPDPVAGTGASGPGAGPCCESPLSAPATVDLFEAIDLCVADPGPSPRSLLGSFDARADRLSGMTSDRGLLGQIDLATGRAVVFARRCATWDCWCFRRLEAAREPPADATSFDAAGVARSAFVRSGGRPAVALRIPDADGDPLDELERLWRERPGWVLGMEETRLVAVHRHARTAEIYDLAGQAVEGESRILLYEGLGD
jgi:hypothetical protein